VFIGHFAVGFAAKRLAPRASLGVLMAAPLFADLLWPIFLIAGIETVRIDPGNTVVTPLDLHDFPWSHSLVTSLAWDMARAVGNVVLVVALGRPLLGALDRAAKRMRLSIVPVTTVARRSATSVG